VSENSSRCTKHKQPRDPSLVIIRCFCENYSKVLVGC